MKKYLKYALLMVIIAMLYIPGQAQSVYFPSQEGMTLEYADRNAKGKVTGYVTFHIQKIDRRDDNNFSVNYLVSSFDDKHKELFSGMEVTIKVINSSVHFDGTSMLANLSKDIKIEGNGIVIPSDIQAGQKLDDFTVTIEALGTTNTCTDVTVVAQEQLSTEAGAFDAYRVDMKFDSKVVFIKLAGTVSQWYAKGIGEVKTVNYDKKGKVSTSRELIKLTVGH
jgi:hypothetical protein